MTPIENDQIEYKEEDYIRVIGADNKHHIALPWADNCKCGMKISKKIVKPTDYTTKFSCYECLY